VYRDEDIFRSLGVATKAGPGIVRLAILSEGLELWSVPYKLESQTGAQVIRAGTDSGSGYPRADVTMRELTPSLRELTPSLQRLEPG
jgi:hypothetical protein